MVAMGSVATEVVEIFRLAEMATVVAVGAALPSAVSGEIDVVVVAAIGLEPVGRVANADG